ncbi:GatB/YqeY domain-containing protein [Evansella sp. AB-P1]|uniref:GatB/YqeY domain-containing protein n=1 Tax=Evansella sp. AB-P1 TaxID=3037653 RepID=UPI00241CC158|nr:GatB/YqeY domain-containing protein [Evansella sp. AB-P1]MDG5786541.1 GatB/YqeY domain-containing protein [Evansella sp. AB-P1]
MNLLDQLNQDMKDAMKKKEKQRLTVIRSLKSALQNEAIDLGRELSDDESLTVLSREMKKLKESLQGYEQANREDLVEKTKVEIELVEVYMPSQLSDEELEQIVKETISEVGATSKADMGKVMGAIMPKVKGRADGKKINQLVQKLLT